METIREVLENKGFDVYSTTIHATVDDAVVEMCRVKVGALLVVDDLGHPAGMLSERDLLIRVLLAHRDPAKTMVRDVMTPKVVCVREDQTIEGALALMTNARCRHLPVVRDEDDEVIGVVSVGDLARVTLGDHEHEIEALHAYVEGRYPG